MISPYVGMKSFYFLIIGLAAYYAWVRAKHFGCHSVCQCVCHNGIHFEVIKLEHCVLCSH